MRNPLAIIETTGRKVGASIEARSSVPLTSKNRIPQTSVNLFSRGAAGVQLDATRSSSIVHSIVRRYSSDVARQEYVVAEWDPRQSELTQPERIQHNHPLHHLFARPNPRMTPTLRAFLQLGGQYLELLGEATILVVSMGNKPDGQPLEIYQVRPDRLQPVPDAFEWLAGWIYTSDDGERIPLRPDQIIQVKYADPSDPYRGLSPLRASLTKVGIGVDSAEWLEALFANSGMPGGLLKTDENLSPGEFQMWMEKWNEQNVGVHNAGRVAFLDTGGTFTPLQMSMVDMQLVEVLKATDESIREAFGISKTILGQTEDVNRATAEAAQQIYGQYPLQDRVDLWLEAFNELLARYGSTRLARKRTGVPSGGLRVEIVGKLTPDDHDAEVKDRDSRVRAWSMMVAKGADPVQAAEVWDLPAVDFPEPEPEPALTVDAVVDPELPPAGDRGPDDGENHTPKELVELLQKGYLGVGPVVEQNELRALLRANGWGPYLGPDPVDDDDDPEPPPVVPPLPVPPGALPPGAPEPPPDPGDDPDDDD